MSHTLSKSDFKLARTCATKLYYREMRYPDTSQDDEYLAMLAEGGYMVELLAKQLFPEGITLPLTRDSAVSAAETMRRLAQEEVTLFEATLLRDARMARVDILRRSAQGFDLYEVKSSSFDPVDADKRRAKTGSAFGNLQKPTELARDWIEYLEDVTYQTTILSDLFPGIAIRSHLILLDSTAVAEVDDMPSWFRILRREDGRVHTAEFRGDVELARRSRLLVSLDVSAEVARLEPAVREASDAFVASLGPTLQRTEPTLSRKCQKCEFRVAVDEAPNGFLECWGARGTVHPHVLGLYQGRGMLDDLIAQGVSGVAEIPDGVLANVSGSYAARQRLQVEHARSGAEWVGPALGAAIRGVEYPLHFIDFEAAGLAIPHHRGMTPYGRIAWQWSCHTIPAPGAAVVHREFIHEGGGWPNEHFATSLRAAIGERGTVLVWSPFEGGILRSIADELEARGTGSGDLVNWLRAVAQKPGTSGARIVDMLALCREHYLHPQMEGSNSIKAVLDAVWKGSAAVRADFARITGKVGAADVGPYAALPPLEINGAPQRVAEGTGAIRAYFAMTYGVERDDPVTRAMWRRLLLDYCALDTLAMVLIWEHWMRITER